MSPNLRLVGIGKKNESILNHVLTLYPRGKRSFPSINTGREKEGWPDKRSIDYFPCEDLRIIDRLWVNYSDGRFGFSVQKGIYQSLGGTEKYDEKILQAFSDRVGWRKEENWLYYSNLIFSPKAPVAHLPSPPVSFIDIFDPFVVQIAKGIFSRVGVCKV